MQEKSSFSSCEKFQCQPKGLIRQHFAQASLSSYISLALRQSRTVSRSKGALRQAAGIELSLSQSSKEMDQDFASMDRYSSISRYSKRLSIASDGWPSSPLLPHTPTASGFPRSSSGQSIPIYLDAEDDDVDAMMEEKTSEGHGRVEFDKTPHRTSLFVFSSKFR